MCLYPKIIDNPKYLKNEKNGGVIPAVFDERIKYVPIGCGKCMECKKKKAREWNVRLQEEIKENKNGKFVTMTFSEESLTELEKDIRGLTGYNLENKIATKAVRRFLERWRKKYKKSIRHWLVTELGGTRTERIHIHGIIWSDKVEEIKRIWKYGEVWIGEYVNGRTIGYIVKYINKVDEKHKEYDSKVMTSAGIGRKYTDSYNATLNKYKEGGTSEEYRLRNGNKLGMPIYYRNKIYTEEEREKLWIEKLDKEERWVDGIKVDISNGEDEYWEIVKEARKKNIRLGYGDNKINWERRKYENQRRNLIKEARIRKKYKKGG